LTTAEDLKKQMAALESQLNTERGAWKAELARSRTNQLLWMIAAGAAGYMAGR
jgi:hypothetical protein